MAKKNTPIITHTEILCLAIRSLMDEIKDYERRGAEIIEKTRSKEIADNIVAQLVAPITPKLEALKEMYRIETGTDFD